jgi:hypothetical protein
MWSMVPNIKLLLKYSYINILNTYTHDYLFQIKHL